jgi:predicted ATP-grasp superfamily ATP-dependent carboligase
MAPKASLAFSQLPPISGPDRRSRPYDALVLDAACRQSLAIIRSLGRSGLRVAAGACSAECHPSSPVIGFRSRYPVQRIVLPSFATDPDAYGASVVSFVRNWPTLVVIPATDESIAALLPRRQELSSLGCTLALTSDQSFSLASDKDRTLALARDLGVAHPRTIPVRSIDEIPTVLSELGLPAVLKPNASCVEGEESRLYATEVVSENEAVAATRRFLDAGVEVLAQELATGQREGVTLLVVDGRPRAIFGHVEYRTTPALGGASVIRESVPVAPDLREASIRLARAIGIEGPCGVEFRRDAEGRPLLMEVNARMAGTVETAVRCGVDLPLMAWRWARGLSVDDVATYRTGLRMRWLRGDMRWLRDNHHRVGRPDSLSRGRALQTFATDFLRVRHYDCMSWRDISPFVAEMTTTLRSVANSPRRQGDLPVDPVTKSEPTPQEAHLESQGV